MSRLLTSLYSNVKKVINNSISKYIDDDDEYDDDDYDDYIIKKNSLYEVHITIDHEDNYVKLINYVFSVKNKYNMKIIYAVSESKNNQYMISYYMNKETFNDAIEVALEIKKEMEDFNIKVIRTKVELCSLESIPKTIEEYKILTSDINKYLEGKENYNYYEFHFKIVDGNDDNYTKNINEDLKDIQKDLKDIYDAETFTSYNIISKTKIPFPLFTVRFKDLGYEDCDKIVKDIIKKILDKGYLIDDNYKKEFAIYDDNINLDK